MLADVRSDIAITLFTLIRTHHSQTFERVAGWKNPPRIYPLSLCGSYEWISHCVSKGSHSLFLAIARKVKTLVTIFKSTLEYFWRTQNLYPCEDHPFMRHVDLYCARQPEDGRISTLFSGASHTSNSLLRISAWNSVNV